MYNHEPLKNVLTGRHLVNSDMILLSSTHKQEIYQFVIK